MKKLTHQNLKTRRQFLKKSGQAFVKPLIVVYTVKKTIPPIFAREPF